MLIKQQLHAICRHFFTIMQINVFNYFTAKEVNLIGCGTTTVRLVSSGAFDNSVTVIIRQMTEDDITHGFMNVICPLEENLEQVGTKHEIIYQF